MSTHHPTSLLASSPHHHHSSTGITATAAIRNDEEDAIYPALWRELYTPASRPGMSSFLFEFVKNLAWSKNVMNISMPSIILSGFSLLETTARSFAPTRDFLKAHLEHLAERRLLRLLRYLFNACHFHYYENGYLRSKPFNPVLGEQFTCNWNTAEFGTTQFVSEQVSHHPPFSALHLENKHAHICLETTIGVHVGLGFNKATTSIFGPFVIRLKNWNEEYHYSRPQTIVNNLLIGKGNVRVAGTLTVTCPQTGCTGKLDFRELDVSGSVSRGNTVVYEITKGNVFDKIMMNNRITGKQETFWNQITDFEDLPIHVPSLAQQLPNESRRVWHEVSKALSIHDYVLATDLKNQIEGTQRSLRKREKDHGSGKTEHKPLLFRSTGKTVDSVPEFVKK